MQLQELQHLENDEIILESPYLLVYQCTAQKAKPHKATHMDFHTPIRFPLAGGGLKNNLQLPCIFL